MLDIFSKTVPMSKLSTNAHKYPKYIHSVQTKCLRNFKNRNKSTIHNNKWRDSQSLLHSNIQNYVLQRLLILIINLCSISMLIRDYHFTMEYLH